MYEKHFTESGSKTKMQKLSVTAGISFLMVEALAISNLIESVRPVTENPSTITVMHCIGWFCMTMYYVRIIFGKTEEAVSKLISHGEIGHPSSAE